MPNKPEDQLILALIATTDVQSFYAYLRYITQNGGVEVREPDRLGGVVKKVAQFLGAEPLVVKDALAHILGEKRGAYERLLTEELGAEELQHPIEQMQARAELKFEQYVSGREADEHLKGFHMADECFCPKKREMIPAPDDERPQTPGGD